MAIIECEPRTRSRIAWRVLASIAVLLLTVFAITRFDRPPQMGGDEDVFRTVDALFTAIGMRDEAKLADCERRVHQYQEAGKLPESSATYLAKIIARARAGNWENASKSLYEFMRAQRRDSHRF
jgi:hypothetical protein